MNLLTWAFFLPELPRRNARKESGTADRRPGGRKEGTDVRIEQNSSGMSSGLRGGFTPLGIWAFSIGTSIGWGSFIVTCNTYLQKSGLLGTVFGLLLGMAVILVITWNLQ